ncbi:hypothetical protein [Nonomuraea sp. NPDC002799]
MITDVDEQAIARLPATAWTDSLRQDGDLQPGYHAAELAGLNQRQGWPENMRLLVRRVRPSARHRKNLTALETWTGWKYSIIATNIGRMWGIAGSHHPQWLDALARAHAHAVVEDRVRADKAMGARGTRRPRSVMRRPAPTTPGTLRANRGATHTTQPTEESRLIRLLQGQVVAVVGRSRTEEDGKSSIAAELERGGFEGLPAFGRGELKMTLLQRPPSGLPGAVPFAAGQFEERLGLGSAHVAGQLVHVCEMPRLPTTDLETRCDGQQVCIGKVGSLVPGLQGRTELLGELVAMGIFSDPFRMQHTRTRQVDLLTEISRRSIENTVWSDVVPHRRLREDIGEISGPPPDQQRDGSPPVV